MIHLVGEGYSIHIDESNPAYKNLLKFSGESVLIKPEKPEYFPENEKTEQKQENQKDLYNIELHRKEIWDEFYSFYSFVLNDETEEPPVYLNTLENYLDNALGGKTGGVEVQQVKENVFKTKNDYYIVWRNNL